jgi:hypothetical protein
MRTMLIALALVCGCTKKPTLEQLQKIRAEACACPDKACAEQVEGKIESALRGVEDEHDLDDKAQAVVMDAAMCLAKQGVH